MRALSVVLARIRLLRGNVRAQIVQRASTLQRLEPQLAVHVRLGRLPPPRHRAAARRAQRASIRLLRGLVRAQIVQESTLQRLEPQLVTAWTIIMMTLMMMTIIMMTLMMMTHGERTYSILSVCL